MIKMKLVASKRIRRSCGFLERRRQVVLLSYAVKEGMVRDVCSWDNNLPEVQLADKESRVGMQDYCPHVPPTELDSDMHPPVTFFSAVGQNSFCPNGCVWVPLSAKARRTGTQSE